MTKPEQESYLEGEKHVTWAEEDMVETTPPEGVVFSDNLDAYVNEAGDEVDFEPEEVARPGAVPESVRYSVDSAHYLKHLVSRAKIPFDRAVFPISTYTEAGGTISSEIFRGGLLRRQGAVHAPPEGSAHQHRSGRGRSRTHHLPRALGAQERLFRTS